MGYERCFECDLVIERVDSCYCNICDNHFCRKHYYHGCNKENIKDKNNNHKNMIEQLYNKVSHTKNEIQNIQNELNNIEDWADGLNSEFSPIVKIDFKTFEIYNIIQKYLKNLEGYLFKLNDEYNKLLVKAK